MKHGMGGARLGTWTCPGVVPSGRLASRGAVSLDLGKVIFVVYLADLGSFPGGSDGKASACSVGDRGSIPGLGRFPGAGNGNSPQYSCLKKLTDTGAW